ncbi:MAG: 3-phosphoshikimate 1-carboxyvinyltransferase [Desulfomonilaceae bacterium]
MKLLGTFRPPGDKSISHRIALLSLLAKGECVVSNYSTAQDCITSIHAVNALGGRAVFSGEDLMLSANGSLLKGSVDVDCGNSGTTMRLLMGILAGASGRFILWGDDSLLKRPMERVAQPLRFMGANISCAPNGTPPVTIDGSKLRGIDYRLPVASAQLKSAVLIAGIQAEGLTRIAEPVKSRDHTEHMLGMFGANIYFESGAWCVRKSLMELPSAFRVPGDPSSAAFFLCGAAMLDGSEVRAEGVLLNPTRIKFLEKLREMGAQIEIHFEGNSPEPYGTVKSSYSGELSPCTVTPEELPRLVDEVPILALLATQAHGVSVFQEIGELRIKESDRVAALVSELGKLGARLEIDGSNLFVYGPTKLKTTNVLESFGDHRIAMTLAIARGLIEKEVPIRDMACVSISYPDFFEILRELTL